MGHHGSDDMSPELMRAIMADREKSGDDKDAFMQKVAADQDAKKFGASGNYPMGTLDKGDEGEIMFGVASHRGKVIINFGKPVAWLGMDARQAAGLAALLIQHANKCRDIGNEQKSQATVKEHGTA